MNNESHNWKQKHALLFANEFEKSMKHSFHMFYHALKTFERDKRLSFPCFHTLYQDQTLKFVFYISHEKLSSGHLILDSM